MEKGKRALVLMLSVLMLFSTFPASVFAGDEAASEAAPAAAEAQEPVKEPEPEPAPQPETPAEPVPSEPAENSTEIEADDQNDQDTQEIDSTENTEENAQENSLKPNDEAILNAQAVEEPQVDEAVEYVTVTFNSTEGVFSDNSKTKEIKLKKGDPLRRTDVPEVPQYPKTQDSEIQKGFRGWVTKEDYDRGNYGNYISFNTSINNDLVLCATWGIADIGYGVDSESTGGFVYIDDDESTKTEGQTSWEGPVGRHTLHAVPKEGYKFHYWSGVEGTSRIYEQNYTRTFSDGRTTIYAHFLPADSDIYSIEYYPGEGTSLAESNPIRWVTEAGGGKHELLTDGSFLAPQGKTFEKWEVVIGNEPPIDGKPGDIINVTADTTVTAIYKARPRDVQVVLHSDSSDKCESVTFSGEGVKVNDKDRMLAAADQGSVVIITITPKAGNKVKRAYCYKPKSNDSVSDVEYEFDDSVWGLNTTINDDGSATVTFTVNDGASMWLMAEFEPIPSYAVTFESNGGSSVEAQTVNWGTKAVKPDDPTRDGYLFKGWYSDEAMTAEYDFESAVKDNITLYAKWSKAKVILTFDPNGGVMNGSTAPTKMECASGEEVTIPDAPTRDGYEFQYWEGSQYYPGDKYTVTEDDHTFTAVWKEIEKPDDSKDASTPDDGEEDNDTTKSSKSDNSKKSKVVDTGDAADLMGWILLAIIAETGAAYVYRRRRDF